MSNRHSGPAQQPRGKRHPLLSHQALNEQVFWPSVVIMAAAAALLIWTPPELVPYRTHLRVILVFTGLLLVATYAFRLRSYVQCRGEGLYLQLPSYHLLIPYREIKTVRPDALYRLFPPDQQTWSQRRYLGSLPAEAVVVIELAQLPQSNARLRLWMGKYMLCPDRVGLVLAVRDWMALRGELDESKARSQRPRSTT